MKRILMIIPDFGYGGAEKSFAALSRDLAEQHEVHLVVFNRAHQAVYPTDGTVHSLDVPASKGWPTKGIHFIKRIGRLRKLKKKLRPDISISFLEGADYINVLSGNGEKVVCSIRGSKKYDQNIRGVSRWLREKLIWPYIYRKADFIMTLNNGIAREVISIIGNNHHNKIKTISLKPNVEQIIVRAKEPLPEFYMKLSHRKNLIVSVGRLAPEKGFHLFLPVFKQLLKHIPDAAYLIVGNGEWLPHLIKVCNSLSLSYALPENAVKADKHVYFIGYDSNPIRYMASAELFVLPSTHEGYSNALVEALYSSPHVVVADCPYGPREIISDVHNYNDPLEYPFRKGNATMLPNLLRANEKQITLWTNTITKLLRNPNRTETQWNAIAYPDYTWNQLIEDL